MTDITEAGKPRQLKLASCGRTDVGRKRAKNEDHIEVSEKLKLFAVADGMGGHAAGEVASRAAIETLSEFIAHTFVDHDFTWPFGIQENLDEADNVLVTGINLANRKVCHLAEENAELKGMGTTLAAIYAPDGRIHIGHVGDSRVYRWRTGQLELMTSDHSWVNEQLQRNIISEAEARNHRWRNVITRALGNRAELEVDLRTVDPEPGDIYLLCSDGLTSMVPDERIAQILSDNPVDLTLLCDALVEEANQTGGIDNISVILVRVLP
ncbi:MAG: Stp1/IreP family PP2C-type Ser/Thr phosphatase [bacterium]|nr:Stp1/IreP family PP2C-type Ser/Thr phosphatase [bacterium]